MNYGLPYKGSKNKLATRIVDLLPPRKHFYDLFCGGCAVTHAAMMTRKWEDFTINDLNWQCPTLFIDALNGKYKDDTRWISREDFFRLKDSDPYVAFVWSFGNNLRDYIYSREIEPLKKAIHYALYFDDYSLASAMGHDLSFIADRKTREEKYMAIRHYFQSQDKYRIPSHEGGVRTASLSANWGVGYNVPTIAHTAKESQRIGREYENRTCGICPAQHFTRQQRMSSMERAGLDALLKKKKNPNTSTSNTTHEDNGCYRQQHQERIRRLPQPCGGGVKSVHLQTITQTSRLSLIA